MNVPIYRTREIAVRMAKAGLIDITQKGKPIHVQDQKEIKGPIRLKKKAAS